MSSDKGNKRVTFRADDFHQKTSHRDRDSGVGSSSSTDQASMGGRPDRVFMDKDREKQRFNLSALQEALEDAKSAAEKYKGRCRDLDQQLTESNKKRKQIEALHHEQHDLSEQLKEENHQLRESLKAVGLELREAMMERDEWRKGYLSVKEPLTDPNADVYMMTAAGSNDSPDVFKRAKSEGKHEGQDVEGRLRRRINKNAIDNEPSPSSKSHRHHSSRSSPKKSHGRSSSRSVPSREPYIEEAPDWPSSRATRGHYTTSAPSFPIRTSMLEPPTLSAVPRSTNPLVSHNSLGSHQTTGDYNPQPLPSDPRKHSNGRRNY